MAEIRSLLCIGQLSEPFPLQQLPQKPALNVGLPALCVSVTPSIIRL